MLNGGSQNEVELVKRYKKPWSIYEKRGIFVISATLAGTSTSNGHSSLYWNSASSKLLWSFDVDVPAASLSCMLYDFLYRFISSTSFCQPPLSIYCTLFKKSLQYYIEQSREKRGTFGECTMKAVEAVLESITKCTFFLSALFRLM